MMTLNPIPWRMVVVIVGGTLILGMLDYSFGASLWKQYASKTFSCTTGRITHSEVARHQRIKRADDYDVKIQYHYQVSGQPLEGGCFCYVRRTSLAWANNVVAAHPPGSIAQVFYNPKDPRDSVLSPGLDQSDAYGALTLVFVNIVGFIVFWWFNGSSASQSCGDLPATRML